MVLIYTKNNFSSGHNSVVYDLNEKTFIILKNFTGKEFLTGIPFKISNNFQIPDSPVTYKDGESYGNLVYIGEYDELLKFWKACAVEAMQGYQETGEKVGLVADLLPKETATLSFKMADSMLYRYMLRLVS